MHCVMWCDVVLPHIVTCMGSMMCRPLMHMVIRPVSMRGVAWPRVMRVLGCHTVCEWLMMNHYPMLCWLILRPQMHTCVLVHGVTGKRRCLKHLVLLMGLHKIGIC